MSVCCRLTKSKADIKLRFPLHRRLKAAKIDWSVSQSVSQAPVVANAAAALILPAQIPQQAAKQQRCRFCTSYQKKKVSSVRNR